MSPSTLFITIFTTIAIATLAALMAVLLSFIVKACIKAVEGQTTAENTSSDSTVPLLPQHMPLLQNYGTSLSRPSSSRDSFSSTSSLGTFTPAESSNPSSNNPYHAKERGRLLDRWRTDKLARSMTLPFLTLAATILLLALVVSKGASLDGITFETAAIVGLAAMNCHKKYSAHLINELEETRQELYLAHVALAEKTKPSRLARIMARTALKEAQAEIEEAHAETKEAQAEVDIRDKLLVANHLRLASLKIDLRDAQALLELGYQENTRLNTEISLLKGGLA